jgi:hypothetical protein
LSQDPYARQRLLPEIGDSGQELLRGARVVVPVATDGHHDRSEPRQAALEPQEGSAAAVAADYLRRAGVGAVVFDDGALPPGAPNHGAIEFPHAACFRYAASGEVAAGAWFALDRLRQLLSASRAS